MSKFVALVASLLLLFYSSNFIFEIEALLSESELRLIAAITVFFVVLVWFKLIPDLNHKFSNKTRNDNLKENKSEPLKIAEIVRRQEYVDKQTRLGNRSFFNARLDVLLIPDRLSGEGSLTLISLTGLEKSINEAKLFEAHYPLITESGIQIENAVSNQNNPIIARVSPLEFAVVMHPISKNQSKKIANDIEHALNQIKLPEELNDGNFFHIGVTTFSSGSTRFELMANADLALRTAQLKGGSCWHQLDSDVDSPIWGMLQWRTFFETVIGNKQINLYLQPVLDLETRELVHSEVFARLQDKQGKPIFANEFVPMASACGMLSQVDKIVIDQLINWYLLQPKSNQRLCINLSIESLLDDVFVDWLIQKLSVKKNLFSKFIVEFSERPSLEPDGKILEVVKKLNHVGIEVGIDHVGERLVDLSYLEWFPISYLKIHQSIIYSITNEQHHHHELLIQSLAKVANNKNFLLMAEGIEKEIQIELLDELGISAGQGFFLGTPKKLN
jgi:RNase E specificity factor CsrD